MTLPPPKVLPKEVLPKEDNPATADEPQDRSFLVNMDQAVELAVINSREFQTQRENLYLAALPVSQARFSFAAQFFALETAIREVTGSKTSSGKGNRWRVDSTNGFTKLFPTGALLLAAFANKTVINLTGTDPHTLSQSTINLDIIQPLLRGGGLAVTLEPLTQAERNLLYQIRFYARFRKEFYQALVSGGDFSGALSIPFGVGGGVAIASLSLGTGNPARPEVTPGSAGSILLGGGQLALTEGYLPTLLRRAQLNIERNNARALEDYLKLFESFVEPGGEGIYPLQVDQVRLQLLDAQTKVLQKQQDMRDALDRFKLQLGVPVPLGLDLTDEPIQQITRQMERFEIILEQFKKVTKEIGDSDNPAEAQLLRGRVRRLLLESDLVRDTKDFRRNMVKRLAEWEQADSKQLEDRLAKMGAQVRDLLDRKTTFERKGAPWPSSEQKALAELEASQQVGELEKILRRYQAEPWKKEISEKERRRKHSEYFTYVRIPFSLVLSEANRERFDLVRPLWPTPTPVEVDGQNLLQLNLEAAYDVTARTALSNRLDLMNARAQVQDAWRQIAIYANSLLGTFLIGYHIDTATPPNEAQPFTFAGSRTRNQLILNLDLPLVRLPERNNYRASLIAYQRQRRALMAAEDFVINQVRADLRLLRVLAENFKIQQEAVALAYLQVENSLETFQAPPEPGGRSTAAAAASLTQQLLSAQRGLLQGQDQLLKTWISYQIARRQLYLNLELLPLDPRGVWLDDLSSHENAAAIHKPSNSGASPTPPTEPGQPGLSPSPARLLPPRYIPPALSATR